MERTFYNNAEIPIIVVLRGDYLDSSSIASVFKKIIQPKETVTFSVHGDYISRLEFIVDQEEIEFNMSLRVLEKVPKITNLLKYEKFVLNYKEINEIIPPEYFQISIIPMI
ncbi:hypothetical protein [Xenorhabdus budapestensis]|uniref:Uncharacterized protein n=1 Tax=Xenorhabdus budapestensis TaxID=290110 RepID=A0A2D0J0I9_XENBU|nr:hypothetical protein [Xenorhabdus budapestensis]PHM27755.1 hypothetical protein Xbud_02064 [Xenorhabdus budapestensis]